MATTYKNLVNAVQQRLRQAQTGTVDTTTYSSLLGALVNDAKLQIEQAHFWLGLRETITVTTVAGTKTYSLAGTGNDSKINWVYNDTSNWPITRKSYRAVEESYLNTDTLGSTRNFAISSLDSNDDQEVYLYPKPNSIESLKFRVHKAHTADLVEDTDTISIPKIPIIQLAYAMAIAERGEDGGITSTEQFAVADRFLQDAIALEANTMNEELIWYPD